MSKYKAYFLHDPIGNTESQIVNFDRDALQNALDSGLIIIGITRNDTREIVKSIKDISRPDISNMEGFTVVLPSYVDSKVDTLANVIEKLIDGLNPLQIKSSVLSSVKKSIQQIHEDTLKVIEEDKKMIEASPLIEKKTDV